MDNVVLDKPGRLYTRRVLNRGQALGYRKLPNKKAWKAVQSEAVELRSV